VAFVYEPAPAEPSLRQGELLRNVWLHVAGTVRELAQDAQLSIASVRHELLIPLNADCDLYQDHRARFPADAPPVADETLPPLIPFVILCPAYTQEEVRNREGVNQGVWRRIEQNQDERYYYLPPAPIGNRVAVPAPNDPAPLAAPIADAADAPVGIPAAPPAPIPAAPNLPGLVLDFKKTVAAPTPAVYDGLAHGVVRVAVIPPVYLHDLMHRFYGFHSRVALPE